MSGAGLLAHHDALLLDLDGVLYRGTDPVPHAAPALLSAAARGVGRRFVTNNASRTPEQVAGVLQAVGVDARPDEVLTSAQAAARMLAERLPGGAPVLVVGGDGLRTAVSDAGLVPVAHPDAPSAQAVVQGFGPDVGWRDLAAAVTVARAGRPWVATNTDRTVPSPHGPLPGNGALVAAVAAALGREPDAVAGKPEPALLQLAVAGLDARAALVVGDRLDTDVAGATAAGLPALLVLTGVSTPADVVAAPRAQRPRHVAADLRGLTDPAGAVRLGGGAAPDPGGWSVVREGQRLRLEGSGDPVGALRLVAWTAWAGADDQPPAVEVPAALRGWWHEGGEPPPPR